MNMRISEQYFQKLLDAEDSSTVSKAVFDLDRQWCARDSVSEDKFNFGLSEPEFVAHLCIFYFGEVYNGGHSQFFLNPIGAYSPDVLSALERIGLSEIHALFQQACAVFPDAKVPATQDTREELIQQMSNDKWQVWGQLDRQLYASDQDAWNVMLAYIRENQDQILRPERGMVYKPET